MAKTLPPGTIKVPNVATPFSANAVPDPFDERDLEYRPRLEPLPPILDQRDPDTQFVLLQKGNSCTGHAVATVINTVLARAALAAAIGCWAFADASPAIVAFVTAVAAGAILAMLSDTMIPEAFEVAHDYAGLITVAGFLAAFTLSRALG